MTLENLSHQDKNLQLPSVIFIFNGRLFLLALNLVKHQESRVANFCSLLTAGKLASGFGIGALEEYGVEDEDIYSSG